MRTFDEIYDIAAERKGGADALEALIDKPKSLDELLAIPDDRWLSRFARQIFSAGFSWKVIEAKWEGFEEAFHGFDIGRCAFMDDEMFDRLIQDTRIVRHGGKITSVRDNAVFLSDLRAESGSVAKAIAGWPADDYVGLLLMLKKRGSRLGGATGQYSLRMLGVDSAIFSQDVVARLVAEGVIDKAPTSKRAFYQAQDALNKWRAESGRSLTEISRVLAMSV
ncbi:DNA-3-methyladenine glycosylase I [Falsihalocynthiibacter sp. SS001]|uniref:DNA-3-methyladenine glycosylase I n=1 Tax=Falsihalocynthiibacter sp. SS001 TaxID=3349698 RepID=UPI0036D265E2